MYQGYFHSIPINGNGIGDILPINNISLKLPENILLSVPRQHKLSLVLYRNQAKQHVPPHKYNSPCSYCLWCLCIWPQFWWYWRSGCFDPRCGRIFQPLLDHSQRGARWPRLCLQCLWLAHRFQGLNGWYHVEGDPNIHQWGIRGRSW